ncbi:MAG: cyclophilin-like fold protein [Desulfobacterales bacterium]
MDGLTEAKRIILDFGVFRLEARLFDTPVAVAFAEKLPLCTELTQWGNELYGPAGSDLGEDNLVEDVPPGSIAYTNRGNLVCIFFGQKPAWPVDWIGQIEDEQWRRLLGQEPKNSLAIRTA